MEVTLGTVVDGKVVVEGARLPEGARVTVVLDDDAAAPLTESQRHRLAASVKQADDGSFTDGWALLEEIKRPL